MIENEIGKGPGNIEQQQTEAERLEALASMSGY